MYFVYHINCDNIIVMFYYSRGRNMIGKIFAASILFSALAVGGISNAPAKEVRPAEAKESRLPDTSESLKIKTDSTGWVDFSETYAHVNAGMLSFDNDSTNAYAKYDSNAKELTLYSPESYPLISGIKADGEFDLKISFSIPLPKFP